MSVHFSIFYAGATISISSILVEQEDKVTDFHATNIDRGLAKCLIQFQLQFSSKTGKIHLFSMAIAGCCTLHFTRDATFSSPDTADNEAILSWRVDMDLALSWRNGHPIDRLIKVY